MKTKLGFTLLETLLAMLILSSGILLLNKSWSSSFMRIRKTQINTEVSTLLQRKMVDIDMKYRGKTLESIPEEEEDDFGSDYPQYRWALKSKELVLPDFSSALTSQDGGANERLLLIMKQLTDHLAKAVKEVKVSVFYKPDGSENEVEYSVTTYYVDYNKDLAIPGLPVGGL